MMGFMKTLFGGSVPSVPRTTRSRRGASHSSELTMPGPPARHRTRGWNPPDLGAVAASVDSVRPFELRARDAFRNDSLARQIIEVWIDDAVRLGFRSSILVARCLGRADRVNALWEAMVRDGRGCGRRGLRRAFVADGRRPKSVLVDGEAFVRLRTPEGPRTGCACALVVGACRPGPRTVRENGGARGRSRHARGRARNLLGRVVAYHVRRLLAGRADASANASTGPAADSSSRDATHFRPGAARPGPRHQRPFWRRRYQRLRMLDGFHDASAVAPAAREPVRGRLSATRPRAMASTQPRC